MAVDGGAGGGKLNFRHPVIKSLLTGPDRKVFFSYYFLTFKFRFL